MTEKYNDTDALILAAGGGERLGQGPKAYLKLGGLTLAEKAVAAVAPWVNRIFIALPDGWQEHITAWPYPDVKVVGGGATRQKSLENLLGHSEAEYVVVHEISRPLASVDLIHRIIKTCHDKGNCATVVYQPIPAALIKDGLISGYVDKTAFGLPQAPQCYRRKDLAEVYREANRIGMETQTTWQLFTNQGRKVFAVKGEPDNIKITYSDDLKNAAGILEKKRETR